jgi:hypothetical protein
VDVLDMSISDTAMVKGLLTMSDWTNEVLFLRWGDRECSWRIWICGERVGLRSGSRGSMKYVVIANMRATPSLERTIKWRQLLSSCRFLRLKIHREWCGHDGVVDARSALSQIEC